MDTKIQPNSELLFIDHTINYYVWESFPQYFGAVKIVLYYYDATQRISKRNY